jgi:ADP-L-glycero-D-manno-heptose 6-epimerase
MASVAFHFFNQYLAEGRVRSSRAARLRPGEQIRDFIRSTDVVRGEPLLPRPPGLSGIFNVGTGQARELQRRGARHDQRHPARAARAGAHARELRAAGTIEYVPFPAQLVGKYQSYTQADMAALRKAGYGAPFLGVDEGVDRYVQARFGAGEGK